VYIVSRVFAGSCAHIQDPRHSTLVSSSGQNSDLQSVVDQRLLGTEDANQWFGCRDRLDHGGVLRLVESCIPAKVIETTHTHIGTAMLRQHTWQRDGRYGRHTLGRAVEV
jgi:hypothetical protein